MTAWLNDVRFALRLLLSRPVVTAAAALSLGLGIGANTAIFSLVNEVFLSPLPVERPAELVALFTTVPQNQQGAFGQNFATSRMNFEDYRTRTDVFTDLAAAVFLPLSLSGGSGEPEQVSGQLVTGNYFRTARPADGPRPRLHRRRGRRARIRPGHRAQLRPVATPLRRRPRDRRAHRHRERAAAHRDRRDQRGLHRHRPLRRRRLVGAVLDAPRVRHRASWPRTGTRAVRC